MVAGGGRGHGRWWLVWRRWFCGDAALVEAAFFQWRQRLGKW
jgi:hypothetical protein